MAVAGLVPGAADLHAAIGLMATLGAFLKGRPLIWPSVDMVVGAMPTVIPLWLTGLVVIAIFRRFASEA
ncbi:MAG: hypothetical protein CMM46_14315 [Rhodospirillaceae bacterium]|nr:hypothetical protein [Rhodospirillaceae bacterium]